MKSKNKIIILDYLYFPLSQINQNTTIEILIVNEIWFLSNYFLFCSYLNIGKGEKK